MTTPPATYFRSLLKAWDAPAVDPTSARSPASKTPVDADNQASTAAPAKRPRSGNVNMPMLRDLLLICVLPTTMTMCAVAVIAVERMQGNPFGIAPQQMVTTDAWLACGFAFVILHLAFSYIASPNTATVRHHMQRWAALALVVGAGCLVMFGWPKGWSVPQLALGRTFDLMFLVFYINPILYLVLPLALFAVGAVAFGALLALATSPSLFRPETRVVAGGTFIAHILVAPIALLVAIFGSFFAQAMFPSIMRVDGFSDLITVSSALGAPYSAATVGLLSCAIACSLMCGATFFARHPSAGFAYLPTILVGFTVQIAITAALVGGAGTLVRHGQTIFGLSTASRFPALANYVRGGIPSMQEPTIVSGRRFEGPFVTKRHSGVGLTGLVLMLQQTPATTLRIAIQFNPERKRRPLTCPEISGRIFQCRYIIVAPNRPLDKFILQREFAPRYFNHRPEDVRFEFSSIMPDAWLWRDDTCWLHLENWPAKGDLVQSAVDCQTDWIEQATRLRESLEQFPRRR